LPGVWHWVDEPPKLMHDGGAALATAVGAVAITAAVTAANSGLM
jgi:hypothetical protein